MKKCSKCKLYKPLTEFYSRGGVPDGLEYRCKTCTKKKKIKWYKENRSALETRYSTSKSKAKIRGIEFSLTLEEYVGLATKSCYYCEKDMSEHSGSGLDRLNDEIGYVKTNTVSACTACNNGRNINFTPDEWKFMMGALKEWRKAGYSKTIRGVSPDSLFSKQD